MDEKQFIKVAMAVMIGSTSIVARCQSDAFESLLTEKVELGEWTADEALCIRNHIENTGWPVIPAEAGAIVGLRSETISALSTHPVWVALCSDIPGESHRNPVRFRGEWIAGHVMDLLLDSTDVPWSHSWRIKKQGHWALRLDRAMGTSRIEHCSGYAVFKRPSGRTQHVVGDHVLRWGLGLAAWNASAYDGLGEPSAVVPVTQWLQPAWTSSQGDIRKGWAMGYQGKAWRFSSSLSCAGRVWQKNSVGDVVYGSQAWLAAKRDTSWMTIRECRYAGLLKRNFLWGNAGFSGEWGTFVHADSLKKGHGWIGSQAEGSWRTSRWASEIMFHEEGGAMKVAWLHSSGPHRDWYATIESRKGNHPKIHWGESVTGTGVEGVVGFNWDKVSPKKMHFSWRFEARAPAWKNERWDVYFQCKGRVKIGAASLFEFRYRVRAESDQGLWVNDHKRWTLRWKRDGETVIHRVQWERLPDQMHDGKAGNSLAWMGVVQAKNIRFKCAVAGWVMPEGAISYSAEPSLHGVKTAVMSGAGSRLSWYVSIPLGSDWEFQCAGHRLDRLDRIENSSGSFSTKGPVQTAWDFRLKVSM